MAPKHIRSGRCPRTHLPSGGVLSLYLATIISATSVLIQNHRYKAVISRPSTVFRMASDTIKQISVRQQGGCVPATKLVPLAATVPPPAMSLVECPLPHYRQVAATRARVMVLTRRRSLSDPSLGCDGAAAVAQVCRAARSRVSVPRLPPSETWKEGRKHIS